jgi:hypothetical protein
MRHVEAGTVVAYKVVSPRSERTKLDSGVFLASREFPSILEQIAVSMDIYLGGHRLV